MILENAPVDDRLATGRLVLAPLRIEHAPALFALLGDWEVVRMLAAVPWPLTLADVESHAAEQENPEAGSISFVIFAAGEAVGACGIKKPGSGSPPRVMPRLGYWVGRRFWGRGFATEAIGALVECCFRRFPQDVIGAGVFCDNPASSRVLEKIGFREAGRYNTFSCARGVEVPTVDIHLARSVWRGGET